VLAEVAVERLPAHVLNDLAERGEPVVAIGEPGAWLGRQAEAAAVVLGQGGQRLPEVIALPALRQRRTCKERHERARGVRHLRNSGRVGQQVSHRRGPEGRLRRDQLIGAQVVAGGGIEVDAPLLPQLHHGDRREGLGDGGDPENRVMGDGCVRPDVRDSVPVEELKTSVADRSHRQADGGVAVENLLHSGFQIESGLQIELSHGVPPGRSREPEGFSLAGISLCS